eukprot:scaffold191869_cov29-Tisochrysis_lutea.AAC.5
MAPAGCAFGHLARSAGGVARKVADHPTERVRALERARRSEPQPVVRQAGHSVSQEHCHGTSHSTLTEVARSPTRRWSGSKGRKCRRKSSKESARDGGARRSLQPSFSSSAPRIVADEFTQAAEAEALMGLTCQAASPPSKVVSN